ncbi:MAG: Fe(3+) ABC transporter substrate-binding protein [Spirochaetaceae bacterium]|nr:Fe(3+) ABC transporter substrate-binding protein [Spirochaetaceae bacterium]MDT8296799.1 Fe(3+) ABC transporter substrate-binding protein [Spirochaetaceae bacterium]
MKRIFVILIVILASGALFAEGAAEPVEENVVNVYSHRHYDVDQELYERFTELTGIEVNVVKAGADELIERLRTEGPASPADVVMTVDAGRLQKAVEMNLLQAVDSAELDSAIPEHLRHPDGYWFGLTKRARVLAYSVDRVDPSELSTYEDLANSKWAGRIVVRSSSNIYNQSLMAAMIAAIGEDAAAEWARAIVSNMAREPEGNDRDQVKAVASGLADIAIVNTYYLGKLLTSDDPEEVAAGRSVNLFFPNQSDRGTHINISGAGVTAHAPHRDNAIRFIEFLTSVEAQERYAAGNFEYPIRDDVPPADLVSSWGNFREDDVNLSVLGDLNIQAVIEFDKAGWK